MYSFIPLIVSQGRPHSIVCFKKHIFCFFSCGSFLPLAAGHSMTTGWKRRRLASPRGPQFSILPFLSTFFTACILWPPCSRCSAESDWRAGEWCWQDAQEPSPASAPVVASSHWQTVQEAISVTSSADSEKKKNKTLRQTKLRRRKPYSLCSLKNNKDLYTCLWGKYRCFASSSVPIIILTGV